MANVTAFPRGRRGAEAPSALFADPLDSGETFDLWRLLSVMRRRLFLILTVMVLVPLATGLVVFSLKPVFSGNAKLLMKEGGGTYNIQGFTLPQGLGTNSANLPTETAYLQSRTFAEKVIDKLELDRLPEFNPALRSDGDSGWGAVKKSAGELLAMLHLDETLSHWFDSANGWLIDNLGIDLTELPAGASAERETLSADALRAEVTNSFLDRLAVDGEQLSRVITIEFQSNDPTLAARVPNTIADMFLEQKRNQRDDAVRQSSRWLTDQVAALQERLLQSEEKLERFRREEGLLDVRGTELMRQQLIKLNDQLIQTSTERAEREARLRQVQLLIDQEKGTESIAPVLASTLINNLRLQEAQIQQRLAEQLTTLRDGHPDVIKTRRELEDVRATIAGEVRKIVQSMRNETEIARVREANVQNAVSELKAVMEGQTEAEIALRAIQAEVLANQNLYEIMLNRLAAVDLESQEPEQVGAEVISRAVVPRVPIAPKKKLAVLASVLAAMILAALLALLMDFLIRGFKNAKQVEQATGLPVIASIPLSHYVKEAKSPLFEMVRRRPGSAVGQGIRKLRTALNLLGEGKPIRTVLITSSIAGEGKSSIALALVVNAVSAGLRTLVIDCDTVNGSVTKQLDGDGSRGLKQFLEGDGEVEDAIEFDLELGIHYVATGGLISNSDDLFGSRRMAELLRYAEKNFDFTVVDAGPASVVSDTLVVVPQVDATVFVVEWERTRRETAEQTIREIFELGENLAGIVMSKNDLRIQSIDGGAEAYDGQYYGADAGVPLEREDRDWGQVR
ncbi:Wzz/FepE/Etk N-terminal domain-containing protein [Nisaea acidiphila]|uniref:Wzz/FepE/Etk N-terminal domain-containing protein n=1 Tax=Nisaea acidiphila TaxID=1862145 RepID=A0A9J7B329_9PROT|nr:Wzz/FepE/Etk N-terminal domain-containing protein [Nisaea acidiphila]UUX52053.1 Wzz/FepE/Etk N-terminal domain-containing protein [Nisaea acidiphila]